MRKLKHIAMAMESKPEKPVPHPQPVKRVAPISKSNVPTVMNMLCLLTKLISCSQALLPVTGEQLAPPFRTMQPEQALTKQTGIDLHDLQLQPEANYVSHKSNGLPPAHAPAGWKWSSIAVDSGCSVHIIPNARAFLWRSPSSANVMVVCHNRSAVHC